MYGLVLNGMKDLVEGNFGEEAWKRVLREAGVQDAVFLSMHGYPEELTPKLLTAACNVTGLTPETALEVFGAHWLTFTVAKGYGSLMGLAGHDFVGFLDQLDQLHTRVGLSFPELRPPSFQVADHVQTGPASGSLTLHYWSERDGYAPLVTGIVKALATRFGHSLTLTHHPKGVDGSDHDVFTLAYGPLEA